MDLPIIIPCFFYTEESVEAEKVSELIGKELENDAHFLVQDVYFFNITYVCSHPNNTSTMIGTANEDFRSPLPLDKILELIK
jgi:hypothetical protein